MTDGAIPFVYRVWQRRGLHWLGTLVDALDDRIIYRGWSRSDGQMCHHYFASHGCDRRRGHRGRHYCGVHWSWSTGGFTQ